MSLLRTLIDETAYREAKDDRERYVLVLEAATKVRRAGLEHLVTEATPVEVDAMGAAGIALQREFLLELLKTLDDPAEAVRPFDGGATVRRRVLEDFKRIAGVL